MTIQTIILEYGHYNRRKRGIQGVAGLWAYKLIEIFSIIVIAGLQTETQSNQVKKREIAYIFHYDAIITLLSYYSADFKVVMKA